MPTSMPKQHSRPDGEPSQTSSPEPLDPASFRVLEDITSALIQSHLETSGLYSPRLISNRHGNRMADTLSEELESSEYFDIAVAFVSTEAIRTLFEDFRRHAADKDDIHRSSRLITSTKNFFNPPAAFWDLLRLKDVAGIDVRVWAERTDSSAATSAAGQSFHPKGYIFARRMENGKPYYNLYVGSSNLTSQALTTQLEWNLKVSSLAGGSLINQFQNELASQLADSMPLTEDWIRQYEEDFKKYAPPRRESLTEYEHRNITPNAMQQEALHNLEELREKGEHQAIIISATGTGKTFLSAFDVRAVQPRRMLYIAHQQQILSSAMQSYETILGCRSEELGLFSGTEKHFDRKYVFATVQTMSRPEVLETFASNEFDYILIDEVHHAGAASYQRIINHFRDAEFMLGMTATPERTDGINIFALFGHNIAYEIRLQKALEEDMLCPFHYYGVTEYLGSADEDGQNIRVVNVRQGLSSAETGQLQYEINQLASSERVRYIIDKLQQYSPYHQQVTGLVFCSRIEEARRLSALFNEQVNQRAENRNYRTQAVLGQTPLAQRDEAIRRLQLDENDPESLDYIFTVDLFNEGIDIPAINQIVMLRNTQSSIVFTQQLGRGLRKFPHKESVIVVDFIGNYTNNFLIPIALYGNTGDRDYTRKNLQRKSIGLSSISFDPIARQRVLKSLDTANWSEMKKLTEQYRQLRFQLGRIPMLMDVFAYDPSLPLTLAAKRGNYLSFVQSRERSLALRSDHGESARDSFERTVLEDNTSDQALAILKFATEVLLPGLRPQELVILESLCNFQAERTDATDAAYDWSPRGPMSIEELEDVIDARFPEADTSQAQFTSAISILDFSYFTSTNRSRFGATPLISVSDHEHLQLSGQFADMLRRQRIFRIFFADTLRTGLANCRDLFTQASLKGVSIDRNFIYEHKYTLADVMRLLGWTNEANGQNVGGYLVNRETGTMPIFVKYGTSQYEDRFLGLQEMSWYSKNGRTPTSPEFEWMRDGYGSAQWQLNHFIPLFVMRKEEAREAKYYYVGHVNGFGPSKLTTKPDASGGKTVNVTVTNLHLAQPLDINLYRHLTGQALA